MQTGKSAICTALGKQGFRDRIVPQICIMNLAVRWTGNILAIRPHTHNQACARLR